MPTLLALLACNGPPPPETPRPATRSEPPAALGDAPPADTGQPAVALLRVTAEAPVEADARVRAALDVVPDPGGSGKADAVALSTPVAIEIRGKSSSTFPKPSYTLELQDTLGRDRALPLLGMPPEADWVLHAPYADKSALRNALAYAVARRMGRWAPRARFAELRLNGRYEGMYVAVEKPELDASRVDLPEPTADDPTGGFLFKLEGGTDGGAGWISASGVVYEVHDPGVGEITTGQFAALTAAVDQVEAGVLAGEPLDVHLDVPSFVDFAVVQELTRNVDGYRRSAFLQLLPAHLGGKVRAGPVWDFDIAWGNAAFCDGWNPEGLVWEAEAVCEDWAQIPAWWLVVNRTPGFQTELRCRWEELRRGVLADDAVEALLSDLAWTIREARARDDARWHTLGVEVWPNAYVGDTQSEEVAYLRAWTLARAAWLDASLPGTCDRIGPGAP